MTLPSPAKLNLFLHITGRRPNGYHELQTVFQLLDWGDEMTFTLIDAPGITLSDDWGDVAPEDNLIVRAAKLLENAAIAEAQHITQGVAIGVTKQIPMGGGLGGGSSNAATTLLALNQIWGCNFGTDKLAKLGLKLGADVPVFVRGHSAWAEGVGETLQPIELPENWYVIIAPGCHVSTTKIFSHPELTRDTAAITMSAFFEGETRNDLQFVVEKDYPEVRQALNWLKQYTPALMTGSGSCIFAAFATGAEAEPVFSAAKAAGWDVYLARGVNQSPLIDALHN